MVEMHLLSVNVDFHYDPIYALGVATAFHRFMQGYQPEQDQSSIFGSLCTALNDSPSRYTDDAEKLKGICDRLTPQEIISVLTLTETGQGDLQVLRQIADQIVARPKFKYSRLFGIGLYTLLELADADFAKDDAKRTAALKQVAEALRFSDDKLQKDLELYRSNLEKLSQARLAIEEAVQAERKKREQRAQEKAAAEKTEDSAPTA